MLASCALSYRILITNKYLFYIPKYIYIYIKETY